MADYEPDSFEEKIRALAREFGESVERAAEQIDLDEIADRIGIGGERLREFAELAGQWLTGQFPPDGYPGPRTDRDPSRDDADVPAARLGGRAGPHPLDVPSEAQGLALSALDSGRWKVEPGTHKLLSDGDGPSPSEATDLVGELRARDWIAASGEVTLVGRDALRRWLASGHPG
jgi:hypothetical protein